MGGRIFGALGLILCLLLAGCSGGLNKEASANGPSRSGSSSAPPTAPDSTHSANSCSIRGRVLDAEMLPIVLANVILEDTFFEATTAQDGGFALSEVTPFNYTLVVTKSGYLSHRQAVACVRGQAVEVGVITLELDPTPRGPRAVRYEVRRGLLGCGFTTAGLNWGDFCTGVPGIEGVTTLEYHATAGNITGFVTELVWVKAAATDPEYLSTHFPEFDELDFVNVTTSGIWIPSSSTPRVSGRSVLRAEAFVGDLTKSIYTLEDDATLEFRVRPADLFGAILDDPTAYPAVEVILQTRFDFYLTLFYEGEPIPAAYSHLDG